MKTAQARRAVPASQIVVRCEVDECPDYSYLGEYTDEWPDGADLRRGSAFRQASVGYRELRFFVPAISVQEHRAGLSSLGYSKGHAEELAREYCRQDHQRAERAARGDWCQVGIFAEVSLTDGHGTTRYQSGGLWGVESDAGDYLRTVAAEELADLRHQLQADGVAVIEDGGPDMGDLA